MKVEGLELNPGEILKANSRNRIIKANQIIFKFTMLYYIVMIVGFVLNEKYSFISPKVEHAYLGTFLLIANQLIFYKKWKHTYKYGKVTVFAFSCFFTYLNMTYVNSSIMLLYLPMVVLAIVYMSKNFLGVMYVVWLVNSIIRLVKLVFVDNSDINRQKAYILVFGIGIMYGVATYMVNKMITAIYKEVCQSLNRENKLSVKLYKQSHYDTTTGLLNRNAYNSYVDMFDDKSVKSIACVYIDVNGLHEYNNTYGHQAGDKMLTIVAGIMKKYFANNDIFRIGGDEFVVMCEDISMKEIAEKVRNFRVAVKKKYIHIAVGIEWRNEKIDINKIIKSADEKMYQDKKHFYKTYSKGRESAELYKKVVE